MTLIQGLPHDLMQDVKRFLSNIWQALDF